ncbi:MAG: MBL fold metallo-hydrolase [Thermoleophilia bacterium]|nr:MBL fold metallo-hydrolase [Thermoleophilia bacterium]
MDDDPDTTNHDLTIRWLGHASASVSVGGTTLLFDPVVRWRIAHLRRRTRVADHAIEGVDAVLVSHAHHDHLDLGSLRRVRRRSPDAAWHAPRGAARILERAGFAPVVRRSLGDDVAVGDLHVSAVPAAHGGERLRYARDEHGAEAVGFVVTLPNGIRVWFAGDTAYDDILERVGQVDVALVPVGGWWRTLGPGHMDSANAARALELVGARVAIPIHWGTYHPIGLYRAMRPIWYAPAHELERLAPASVDVRVLEVGEATTIRDLTPR